MGRAYQQIDSFEPWEGGDHRPLIILHLEPEQLETRLGITFQLSTEDLDIFQWAGLQLDTGDQFLLTKHFHSPGMGTQVDVGLYADNVVALDRFLRATGITMEEIKWCAPSSQAN